jgi:hypothetical protein
VAACAHLLIRLYAEGIRGYCAIKQYNKNDRQCVQDPTVVSKGERQWQWYQSRQEPGVTLGRQETNLRPANAAQIATTEKSGEELVQMRNISI